MISGVAGGGSAAWVWRHAAAVAIGNAAEISDALTNFRRSMGCGSYPYCGMGRSLGRLKTLGLYSPQAAVIHYCRIRIWRNRRLSHANHLVAAVDSGQRVRRRTGAVEVEA